MSRFQDRGMMKPKVTAAEKERTKSPVNSLEAITASVGSTVNMKHDLFCIDLNSQQAWLTDKLQLPSTLHHDKCICACLWFRHHNPRQFPSRQKRTKFKVATNQNVRPLCFLHQFQDTVLAIDSLNRRFNSLDGIGNRYSQWQTYVY
ncbi:hypothetical protein VNO78_19155 [Psophocarpus tetragonolobus]|uniref:Uncharacterized protein n=1 Tax=Psophocarpus tetragonolobus TaxID=3891 RepID=A0AAN9XG31_PSOTE